MPEMPNIRRCLGGSDEMLIPFQTPENLEQLKHAVRNNITFIGQIRFFCKNEDTASMMPILKEIGRAWQDFADLADDSGLELSKYHDFMHDIVDGPAQRGFITSLISDYKMFLTEEKRLIRGAPFAPSYPNATIEIPEALTLPSNIYSVNDNDGSLWKSEKPFCRGALFIQKRIKFIEDNKLTYVLGFQTETGEWLTQNIPYEVLLDLKRFSNSCGTGIQVNSNTAKVAMGYLSDFAHSNRNDIPTIKGTTHLGWIGDQLLVKTSTPGLELVIEKSLNPVMNAIVSKGTLPEWIENVFEVAMENTTNGKFLVGLTTTLGSLFQGPLNLPNGYFVHYYGQSRGGKSTTMKAVASAIGCTVDNGLIKSWDNTKVNMERYCHFMGSLGIFLDEAKMEHKSVIQETVYMVANGVGRGRGTVGGIAPTLTWKLNGISTGEFDIRETSNHEGFENRIISLTPKPGESFFKNGLDTAEPLEENFGNYYGTLLPAYAPLVEELGAEEILVRYKQAKKILSERLSEEDRTSGKANTFVGYYALMMIALDLFLIKILNLDPDQTGPYWGVFFEEYDEYVKTNVVEKETLEEKVVDIVTSYFFSNTGKFYDPNRGDNREPVNGYNGKIMSKTRGTVTVGFLIKPITRVLAESGISISEFERAIDKILVRDVNDNHKKTKFTLNSGRPRGYVLEFPLSTE